MSTDRDFSEATDEFDPVPPIGVRNAPDRIWLCVGELEETSEWDELTQHEEAVTWCDSKQFDFDVPYIRADLVLAAMPVSWDDDPALDALAAALAGLK